MMMCNRTFSHSRQLKGTVHWGDSPAQWHMVVAATTKGNKSWNWNSVPPCQIMGNFLCAMIGLAIKICLERREKALRQAMNNTKGRAFITNNGLLAVLWTPSCRCEYWGQSLSYHRRQDLVRRLRRDGGRDQSPFDGSKDCSGTGGNGKGQSICRKNCKWGRRQGRPPGLD